MALQELPKPSLDARPFGARRLIMLTDDSLYNALGVRIAFTGREGGVSESPYNSLNLGNHVGDNPENVNENRRRVLEALGTNDSSLIVPSQVHGCNLVVVSKSCEKDNFHDCSNSTFHETHLDDLREAAAQGCDGIVVSETEVTPLLCFADCAPVIIVAPTGTFAVVHAGWRGAVAGIVSKAIATMATSDGILAREYAALCNIYIGPHIGVECFETGEEVQQHFINAYGAACVDANGHVNLVQAITVDAVRVGADPSRVIHAGICTKCNTGEYFSYRASGGVCGRHGAVAFRKEN